MNRPKIGITTSYKEGTQSINQYYIRAIEQAGGLPLIVPMLETEEAAQEFASLLDGLLITGGPGITRGLTSALPDDLSPVDPVRDQTDERIYRAMQDQPMMGICYGMQFINAMHGGSIFGDLCDGVEDALIHSKGRGGEPHPIRIQPDTYLYQILKHESIEVNTYHVQALASVGEGLRISALAPDGVIEGIESQDGRILGLQFHPERMGADMLPLFTAFVERCRTTAQG